LKTEMQCATFAGVPAISATNLSDLLPALAAMHGERAAVVGEHGALSFADLDRAANRWAAGLLRAGYGAGAHVAVLAGNGPDWLALAFGVWRAGATLVPISTFVTARELGEILAHADANLLIVQPRLRSHDYLDSVSRLPSLPALREIVVLGDTAPPRRRCAAEFAPDRAEDEQVPPVTASESIACILYTSGTTGQPKGVMLSHRAILATVLPTAERTGLASSDSLLSTLPLFWVAGLVIRALPTLATGCTLILVETFTVDTVVDALRRHRPTALHLRPPQVGQLLAHPDFEPSLLDNVRRGGGRVEWYAPHLDPRVARFITGYGMTETAGYVTALDWRDPPEVSKSGLGTPLPGVELRTDGDGEILVRGPGMFSGYYKQAPGTGLDHDGFFKTGDLGRIDVDGTFHFSGRSKDLLRVKGINVSPLEVEAVLATHAAVEAAYVVGLPLDDGEQRLVALIVAKAGVAVAEAELRAVAVDALSHYKRPEQYVFIDRRDVALSGTSKPHRAALAELAARRMAVVVGAQRAVPHPSGDVTPRGRSGHRRSIRLQGYDYTRAGAYFITICAHDRLCLFGEIGQYEVRLSELGRIVEEEWLRTPSLRPTVELDTFVVMPNHFHAVLVLGDAGEGTARCAPTTQQFGRMVAGSVGAIVRGFKSAVTNRTNRARTGVTTTVWQRNYYEHIIRDEAALNRIREYVTTNPQRWALDRENPRREGDDEFDTWLATFATSEAAGLKPTATK
jgi:fatty-acyl-CoA synthase